MDECWLMIADCRTSLGTHLFRFPSLLEEMSTIWSFLGFLFIWSELLTSSRSAVHTRLFSLFAYNPFHFRTNSLFCFLLSGSFTSALIFVLFPLLLWDFKNYYYFLFKKIFIFYTYACSAWVHICTSHVSMVPEIRTVLDLGEQQLQVAVGHHVAAGHWTQALGKSSRIIFSTSHYFILDGVYTSGLLEGMDTGAWCPWRRPERGY